MMVKKTDSKLLGWGRLIALSDQCVRPSVCKCNDNDNNRLGLRWCGGGINCGRESYIYRNAIRKWLQEYYWEVQK